MSDQLSLSCRCGAVTGHMAVEDLSAIPRYVCYCDDCQAFIRYLGRAEEAFDSCGGTEVVHATPASLQIESGTDHLRCLDLRGGGTLRWFAACCGSPIGSTPKSPGFPFASLVATFIRDTREKASIGPIRGRLMLQYAHGDVGLLRNEALPAFRMFLRVARTILTERLLRRHRPTPFFQADGSSPISPPHALTAQEREQVYGGPFASRAGAP